MQYSYETLANDNVQFLQGTQAELNKYLPRSEDSKRGTAVEGAFYLTTDTHRLYVGRKVSDSNSADNGKVFPEEVSNGISVVQSSGELPAAALEAHDGDLYYIKTGNILAAYEWDEEHQTGAWHQINSPAAVEAINVRFGNVTVTDNNTNYNNINFNGVTPSTTNTISLAVGANTEGGGAEDFVWFTPGNNIALSRDTTGRSIKIDAIGNQQLLTSNANASTNNAPIILNEPINNTSSQINLVGAQGTAVSSTYENNVSTITIGSFNPTGISANVRGNASDPNSYHGFVLSVEGNDASGTAISVNANSVTLDPVIYYGSNENANSYFHGGAARLNVYTVAETDNAISAAIQNNNKSLDALHWKGTVNSYNTIANLPATGNGVSVGDVYKFIVDANTPAEDVPGVVVNAHDIRNGDTLIATLKEGRSEQADGTIAENDLEWAYIPSGDEPFVVGVASNGGSSPMFGVVDNNLTANNEILKVNIVGGNAITTSAASNNPKNFSVTVSHAELPNAFSTTNASLVAVTANSVSDSISGAKDDTLTFFAVNPNNGFSVDEFGHLTGVSGNTVTIKHTYLTDIDRAYSSNSTTANGITNYTGTITLIPNDSASLTNASGAIDIHSSTIAISANAAGKYMDMDIVWGSF